MIISVHSFRRGTGKTSLTASLACLIAQQGRRVAVLDFDFHSPGVQFPFGVENVPGFVNDAIVREFPIEEAAVDLSARLKLPPGGALIIAASDPSPISVRAGLPPERIPEAALRFAQQHRIDVLFIDNQAGINEACMATMAIADRALVVMRTDKQDHQGTAVLIGLARTLGLGRDDLLLLLNEVPGTLIPARVRAEVASSLDATVIGVLPHSQHMQVLASSGIFVQRYPNHPLTIAMRAVAERLLA